MPIEKEKDIDKIVSENQVPPGYDQTLKILVDGGIDVRQACELIKRCRDKFQNEVRPQILEQAALAALQELCDTPGVKVGDKIDEVIQKKIWEVERSFVSDPKKEMKTIYKAPDGRELKEDSYN